MKRRAEKLRLLIHQTSQVPAFSSRVSPMSHPDYCDGVRGLLDRTRLLEDEYPQ